MNFKKRVNGSWTDTSHYIHNTSTDTLTTLPAVLYPNAVTATVGLKGQMQQSGTPSPASPIYPAECGDKTANLFDKNQTTGIVNYEYINQNGDLIFAFDYYLSYPIKLTIGETYTWSFNSGNTPHGAPTVGFYDSEDNLLSVAIHGANILHFSFTVPQGCAYIRASVYKYSTFDPMLISGTVEEADNTPLTWYEPYGYKIPISSANTTTNIFLGEAQSTRQIKKLVLDGTTEGWVIYNGNYYSSVTDRYSLQNMPCICTHTAGGIIIDAGSVRLKVFASRFTAVASNLEEWKTYLQQQYQNGTPVTVWYVLATPETGIVNEPLMKIGDYADEVSNISIPVTAGGDTISVGTTLQPSEVTATYKGWHPVQSVHERENGQWD